MASLFDGRVDGFELLIGEDGLGIALVSATLEEYLLVVYEHAACLLL